MTTNPASETGVRVRDLVPGDVVESIGQRAVFITATRHPYYGGLQLVVWRLADGYSFDALNPNQVVGDRVQGADPARWWEAVRGTWKP